MKELFCNLMKFNFLFLSMVSMWNNEFVISIWFVSLAIFTQLVDMRGKK